MRVRLLLSPEVPELRADVERLLRSAGHVIAGEPGEPGEPGELVVTDDVRRAEKLRARDPALPILVITRGDDVLARVAALRAGADDAMPFPFHGSQMVARVDARDAGMLAMTKMMVERPLLDHIDDLATTIRRDEAFNETRLHPLVHRRFAQQLVDDDERAFTDWIYDEVFQMPGDDPWLGLVQGFSAIEDEGRHVA